MPILPISSPSEQTRASTLNSLHLRLAVHRPPEPLRQLAAVPELAVLGLHAAQLPCSAAADSSESLGRRLRGAVVAVVAHHGAVLAGFLAVGGEGLGERLGGGGGVDLGGVVDFWEGVLVDGGLFGVGRLVGRRGSLRLGTERRPMNLIMGVCLRRTLVARIFAVVWCIEVCVEWCGGEETVVW